MKLGQTSFIYFTSRIVATIAGFVATIFFARVLGAEVLGVYYLAIGVEAWLTFFTIFGINSAISKRLSEGEEIGEYIGAGAALMGTMLIITVGVVFLMRSYLNAYVGYPITKFIVLLIVVGTALRFVTAILRGRHQVHIVGILVPVRTISRSALQIAAVLVGFEIAGMMLGHAFGTILPIVVGIMTLSLRFGRPKRRHFESLISFARFSWLGQIRARTFNRLDVIVLGFFVSSGLIGVYSISWNVASFLGLFASSLSATLFPELSKLSAQDKTEDVGELVEVAISYAGLIHIPGFIGAIFLGSRILRVYGDEFVKGQLVLVILILAYLIHSYNQQILTALDGIDRPDLAFRTNAVLILSNVVLNVVLVYLFGWVGAAVATTLSVGMSFVVGYGYLSHLIEFEPPISMIGKESFAGILMGTVVFVGLRIENTYSLLSNNVVTVLLLVGLGAGIYFAVLFVISSQFRRIVRDNLGSDVPM